MGHEATKIIEELEFLLSHPAINVMHVERFYNNCLFLYDTVPLFVIVEHMKKVKPKLLKEWSVTNKTVQSLLSEMEPAQDEENSSKRKINIHVDLSGLFPSPNGIYQVTWETEIEEPNVNAHFKTKSLHVFDKHDGQLNLVGISQLDINHYHLYVKKGRKT
ncbi:hypothetical protein [Paenibacillus gansuensis]|uniref:Uncharacterized protein n=1 Tax=Paenibacillus gansuensis TaxID=306542 RepID=A0ABW5PKW3_9BACL